MKRRRPEPPQTPPPPPPQPTGTRKERRAALQPEPASESVYGQPIQWGLPDDRD